MSSNYLLFGNQQIVLKQQTSIGRSPNSVIHIVDNSVSKNHAIIMVLKQNKAFISDLNSVNGTFINGVKITNEKVELKNNDAIQFGRNEGLYIYKERYPAPVGKKINLKDYFFQQGVGITVKKENQSRAEKDKQTKIEKQVKTERQVKLPKYGRQQRLKIPDLADFLIERSEFEQEQPKIQSSKKKKGQTKIELSSLNDLLKDNSSEIQMNIYLKEQEAKKNQQEKETRLKQKQLRMQIERNQKEEALLRKQLEMQKRLKEEEQKINEERKRVQEQILHRAQLRREQQQNNKYLLQKKQQEFIEKLKKQKDQQIADLKRKDQQERNNQEQLMKTDYAQRKKELELEAQGLARQYEAIYRETIQKVKDDISREQDAIQNYQQDIQRLIRQSNQLNSQLQRNSQLSEQLNSAYMIINSKNKALILYASEIQNRIDKLKEESKTSQSKNKNKAKYRELKQSIVNCRKMLNIKKHQKNNLLNEVNNLKISIMGMEGYTHKTQDYLESVLQNNQQIGRMKEEYYEYVEEGKNMEAIWEMDLELHDQILQQQKAAELELISNSKTLKQTLSDNVKKLTEQNLHALKLIQPFITDEKRKAAQYLIQEMVDIYKQVVNIDCEKEQIHSNIHKLITQSQHLRRENQYLSELLFGEGTIHHFDNMKIIINEMIEKISMYREGGGVRQSIKLSQQISKIEEGIQNKDQQIKQLKSQQKRYVSDGNRVLKMNQKNPINFFGQQLAQKDLAITNYQNSIKSHKNQLSQLTEQIKSLEKKKKQVNESFEKYKRNQLEQAKNWIN